MAYIKLVKNKAYFKRFQVKFRRRREGKTDYYARKRLVVQDKTKYNTPKYRVVVRITNKDVIAQITSATIKGDQVHCAAYAHELPRYGLPVGLTNYSSCYCVGLLLARRWLKVLKLDTKYEGLKTPTGEYYVPEAAADVTRKPFKAFLDVGLARTTTGARVFGVMKGAVDGGLNIPYETRRFPGFDKNKGELKVDTFKQYLVGGHVASYMKHLAEEDEEAFKKQFSRFIANGITADNLAALYGKVHAAIRANPEAVKKAKDASKKSFVQPKNTIKRSYKQRKDRIAQILASRAAAMVDEE
nr:60S ribosomal protein L5 [Seculamonas ecuadoriensis]